MRETIFYILGYLVTALLTEYFAREAGVRKYATLSAMITLLLIVSVIMYLHKDNSEKYTFPSSPTEVPASGVIPWQASYSTLDDMAKPDDWDITSAKKCCGVNLDWLDKNSERYKYCSNPKNQAAINMYCCGSSGLGGDQGCKGFVGAPVYFEYTVESDSKWQNPRCSTPPTNPALVPPLL